MSQTVPDIQTLHIQPVDENSAIPFYLQVRIDLLNLLQSEMLKPGDMLPSEKVLSQAYHVSRQTVRQAIGELAAGGMLERTRGRGTTILPGRNRLTFFLNKSFAQQMVEMGLTPQSEVLRKKVTEIDDTSPPPLRSEQGSPALELVRLRFGNEVPIGVQYTTIVTTLCPDLATFDFKTESLYQLLLSHYRLPIARIDQSISAVVADEWHRNLLKVAGGSPLLRVNTTAYLDRNDPIETSTSYYRADRYEYSISQNY